MAVLSLSFSDVFAFLANFLCTASPCFAFTTTFQASCKSGPTDLWYYVKTTYLHHCPIPPSTITATHVTITITLATGTATCSAETTHQHYKSGPTDLQHYDKTIHLHHCLTLPGAITATHVTITISLTAGAATGDGIATCGTETTHQHQTLISVLQLTHAAASHSPAPSQPHTLPS